MKVHLLYPDRDLDLAARLPAASSDLVQDLGLDIVFAAMGGGDRFVFDVSRHVVLARLDDPAVIRWRQDALDDCARLPGMAQDLYAVAIDAIERQRKVWGWSNTFAESVVRRAVETLELLIVSMRQIREVARANAAQVHSEAFRRLFAQIEVELDDAFLADVEAHLRRLGGRDEVNMTATLGVGARSAGFMLTRRTRLPSWRERFGLPERDTYVYEIAPRDEAGSHALGELRNRGLALAADAIARSSDHVVSFFTQVRNELAFYLGCLNLAAALGPTGAALVRPEALDPGTDVLETEGLYDVALRLASRADVVGNNLACRGVRLLVVTGANRGGKSTFLRSLGAAQVMMQAGMPVGARRFRADVRPGVLTHFRREEDAALEHGKLDEELGRMSVLVDRVDAGTLVLMNESFASTNEREGSEIGRGVIEGLIDAGAVVALVTHMYDLASGFHADGRPDVRFLRAERLADGRRTFRVVDGEPQPTSHGQDLYERVFG
jgi:MutS domain V